MKIAIMQPYLFPYIGYWQLFNAADTFIILDDVNYIKRGWINSNIIKVNGSNHVFTMPINGGSQNKLIHDILILDISWKINFLKTIEFSYKKSTFFNQGYEIIKWCFDTKEMNLSKFIFHTFNVINEVVQTHCKIVPSSVIYNSLSSSHNKIIDICKKERATTYINPIGGQALYNKEFFKENHLELSFLKCNSNISSLSIIDVLMNNSIEDIKIYLDHYELL